MTSQLNLGEQPYDLRCKCRESARYMGCSLLISGLAGGEDNGRRGYMMTFAIAYIRVSNDIIVTSLLWVHTGTGSGI